jgi:hypothetical protein
MLEKPTVSIVISEKSESLDYDILSDSLRRSNPHKLEEEIVMLTKDTFDTGDTIY